MLIIAFLTLWRPLQPPSVINASLAPSTRHESLPVVLTRPLLNESSPMVVTRPLLNESSPMVVTHPLLNEFSDGARDPSPYVRDSVLYVRDSVHEVSGTKQACEYRGSVVLLKNMKRHHKTNCKGTNTVPSAARLVCLCGHASIS